MKALQQNEANEYDKYEKMHLYDKRILYLGLEKWKWHMNDLRYKYLSYDDVSHEYRQTLEEIIVNTLLKYETMERTSLLELAIWKHYEKGDRTRDKQISCGMNVIITGVIKFL